MIQSLFLTLMILIAQPPAASDKIDFNRYFIDKTLRMDIHHFGASNNELFCIDELKEEPFYAGPLKNLIHEKTLGGYYFDLYDAKNNTLIYSRGFCTLFGEWRTTKEAMDGGNRVFEQSLLAPYPKKDVILTISSRTRSGDLKEIFRQKIIMDKKYIHSDLPSKSLKTHKILYSGDPHKKVDVLILGDGYSSKEMKKYVHNARKAADRLLSVKPLLENKRNFNIWAVESPSLDTGVDEPRKESFKTTALGTTFNFFNLAHYSMTMKIKAIHDIAAAAPHDFIIIIFNSSRYGGGGIYNLYAMVSGHNGGSTGVITHEFGHLFAGLADEYYTSPVTYIDFYPAGVEPWEPNITALLDPKNPKWKEFIKKGTPIPTPTEPGYSDAIGCFEGAGYRIKGLFRPSIDCIMHTCRNGFCQVCIASIEKEIQFYTD